MTTTAAPALSPGAHDGILSVDYHQDPAIGSTSVRQILRAPALYWRENLDPDRPARRTTPAMCEGTALHTLILEPEHAASRVLAAPVCDRRTKAGKQAWAEWCAEAGLPEDFTMTAGIAEAPDGRIVASADKHAELEAIAAQARMSRVLKYALTDAVIERSYVWQHDTASGLRVPCKVRPDTMSHRAAWDLKTVPTVEDFDRRAYNAGMAIQAAMYVDGINAIAPESCAAFYFIAVERNPHRPMVLVAEASDDMIAFGRHEYRRALEIYCRCRQANLWPGPGETLRDGRIVPQIEPLEMPPWARTSDGDRWSDVAAGEL